MNSHPSLVVAIATRNRVGLLDRSLRSLALCQIPANLAEVVVVENGPSRSSEPLVASLQAPFPLTYRHVPVAGKNRALNEVVRAHPKAFLVFFDDDVRFHPEVLNEYARGLAQIKRGTFLGGRCEVDFEEPPPAWIHRYLPESAKGWSKGTEACEIRQAMGFNWGAFARDIGAAGGFQISRGPGMHHSIGDETEMQDRLVRRGGKGGYLPKALVWHFVPIDRCSDEWVIQRARQMGIARGIQLANWPAEESARFAASCRQKARLLELTSGLFGSLLGRRLRCHYRRSRQWKLGVLEGLKIGAEEQANYFTREQSTYHLSGDSGFQCEPLDTANPALRTTADVARN
jgi:hypothetical protein